MSTAQDIANRAAATSNAGNAQGVWDFIGTTIQGAAEGFGSGYGSNAPAPNVQVQQASVQVNPNMMLVAGLVALVLIMKKKG